MNIALLTDFGTTDYFVGVMKGVILSINDKAHIIDITHEIPPQDIRSAGFTLNACYRYFPAKTIFVAVVDPGVGSDRRAILVETPEYYFIAPDNGLLSFMFDRENNFRVFEITNDEFFCQPVSRTFHGRDIFSPVAAHLSNGISPNAFGHQIKDYVYNKTEKPTRIDKETIEAEIIQIDRFGNLVTNLKMEDLPENFTLEINRKKINKLQEYFAAAELGEIFMIFGSAGLLEVVAFRDSAQNILKVKVGQKVFIKF
jgi:S-adenosylmethionine hydrolase